MGGALRRSAIFIQEVVTAATMPIGARFFAESAVEAANLDSSDRVVDLGCGPGTASRIAARKGATVTGVDPTPVMLRFARFLTHGPERARIRWLDGLAEAIPLDDGEATVALAIRSGHHFDDPTAAFKEIRRVLGPGGRVVIVERSLRRQARVHRRHGFSAELANEMAEELEASGFDQVRVDSPRPGRPRVVLVSAVRP
jgi:ubiquinone/menaquinone biosynthesis C-methylase UbiE